ncbi:Formate dehydrogenase O gamma subunit [Candidatus Syntrophocurvum alkaliphilum]|uniref:Formate dehydrogenase O gamma subunit n=1 Tax=Candidatus Syntrophocurvum alkaliphilum TaxID=2293317 RepID=A0A6I6D7V4_9FIRM|nr:cytochrome b/b6 domain-containing protein [Candidatus Syntrophocurvum alkaliphilum]QGT99103.1 Formate dehydrogenase O gamma subunit [Candidatus Syntrophocurvum alkaliphilum]
MQLLPEYREDVKRVERFSYIARLTHWGHTVTFLLCLFTGLAFFLDAPWLAAIFGGYSGADLVHKIGAVGLTIFVLLFVVCGFKSLIRWVKDLFRFGKNDIIFLMKFPLEFLGVNVKIPPQTKFNGGEKMNSIVTSTSVIVLGLTGYIMWFPDIFSQSIVLLSYPIHGIAAIIATCMVCMHAYLGSFHPGSGESFWGMWKGTVRADWAEHHHKVWYDEQYGEDADSKKE